MLELLLLPVAAFCMWMLLKLLRGEAIFVPLPQNTVRQMLQLAGAGRRDVVYDLGSGDGRVVIAAAKLGCRAVGIERSRLLCWLARRNAMNEGVNAEIVRGDFFMHDMSDATVVMMYLSKKTNEQLKGKLNRLKKGTRIVSASHAFEGWKIVKKIKTGHFYCYLYKV